MAQFSALESGLRADDGPATSDTVSLASVSAKYFQALGIPLVSGRFFDARDGRHGTPVAIVNQTLARSLFQGRNPLGRRINSTVTVIGESLTSGIVRWMTRCGPILTKLLD